jgi:hypothetical protein
MYKKWPISPSLKSARSKNNMKVFQKLVKFFNISYAFCVQTIRYLSFITKNSPGLEEGVKSSMSFMKCLITRLIPNTNVKSLNNVEQGLLLEEPDLRSPVVFSMFSMFLLQKSNEKFGRS